MESIKRKRSPNWLAKEKFLLVDLAEKHFQMIENKKTDGVSIKAKCAEWQIICNEYNSQTTHCYRDAENLKNQWESMKKAAKKEAAHVRMQRFQTGGGPLHKKKEDPVYSRILSLIVTSAVGLHNPYDKDNVVPMQVYCETVTDTDSQSEHLPDSCNKDILEIIHADQPHPVRETMGDPASVVIDLKEWSDNLNSTAILPHLYTNSDEDVNMTMSATQENTKKKSNKDWGDYTPQLLKTPVSYQLKTAIENKTGVSRRRPVYSSVKTSLETLHQEKIDAIKLQKDLAIEESERNKKNVFLDIEIKKEILKQEKLKTRILLLELRKKKILNNLHKIQKEIQLNSCIYRY